MAMGTATKDVEFHQIFDVKTDKVIGHINRDGSYVLNGKNHVATDKCDSVWSTEDMLLAKGYGVARVYMTKRWKEEQKPQSVAAFMSANF